MAFWERFSECYPREMSFPEDDALNKVKTWMELYQFLSRSRLRFDCSLDKFIDIVKKDRRLWYLWKKSTNDSDSLDFRNSFDDLCQILIDNPLCFLLTNIGMGRLSRARGIIGFNSGNWPRKGDLFIDNGLSVKKDDPWNWGALKTHIPDSTSNSMIVVDNYILGNLTRLANLFAFLDLLLPDSCEMDYHLTIFHFNPSAISEEELLARIVSIRPGLINLRLEIIKVVGPQEFHDRAILTNNYWIGIGGGLDISTNSRIARTTTIDIAYPYLATANTKGRIDDAYEMMISEAKTALSHARATSVNRLLV